MIEVLIFTLKYKINSSTTSLPSHCKEFFSLSPNHQKKVLDRYFKHQDKNLNIDYYFNSDENRYYENNQEITFFSSPYFNKKIIDLNPTNIKLIDNFKISESNIDNIINYTLNKILNNNIKLNINDILIYPNRLPSHLSQNIDFMTYLTNINIYNIKYITYNEKHSNAQRELIKNIIPKLENKKYDINKFLLQDKTLPKSLKNNIDFIIYIIKNDLHNIKYIDEITLNNQTITAKHSLTNAIITSLKNNPQNIYFIEKNISLANYLNKDQEFINYIITLDVNNISYIDWHNLTPTETTNIINHLSLKLIKENISLTHSNYPFKNILTENYMFMTYLITNDKKNIKEIRLNDKTEINKLIDIYLNKYKRTPFDLDDFLDEDGYINHRLIENKHMLSYLIKNDNNIFKHINFLSLNNSKEVVENIIKEISKKDFNFNNESFLKNNKYPIPLSNSYIFMRYVIDKNFNNLSYIDISMIDEKRLKKIINYAFRMVYYIRGDNKNLNFDLDGYFKNTPIINHPYFQECLKSL